MLFDVEEFAGNIARSHAPGMPYRTLRVYHYLSLQDDIADRETISCYTSYTNYFTDI